MEVNYINDNTMTYDLDLHMYTLEHEAVLDILEAYEEQPTHAELRQALIMVRNDFYGECLDYALYRDKYLHYLSLPDNRAYIKEAMRNIFTDMLINSSTPGLKYSDKDTSLVTPRSRKYMQTTKLLLIQELHDTPRWLNEKQYKGIVW